MFIQHQNGNTGGGTPMGEIQAVRTAILLNPQLLDLKDATDLALGTGSRFGELAPLRWCDVDTTGQQIYLGSDRRWVPFDHNVKKLLDARKQRDQPCDFIFGPGPRAVLNRGGRQLAQIGSQLGLKVGFYKLRLTYANQLAAAGVDAWTLCSILGLSVRGLDRVLGLKLLCHRAKAPSLKGTGSRLTLENWTMGSIRLM